MTKLVLLALVISVLYCIGDGNFKGVAISAGLLAVNCALIVLSGLNNK